VDEITTIITGRSDKITCTSKGCAITGFIVLMAIIIFAVGSFRHLSAKTLSVYLFPAIIIISVLLASVLIVNSVRNRRTLTLKYVDGKPVISVARANNSIIFTWPFEFRARLFDLQTIFRHQYGPNGYIYLEIAQDNNRLKVTEKLQYGCPMPTDIEFEGIDEEQLALFDKPIDAQSTAIYLIFKSLYDYKNPQKRANEAKDKNRGSNHFRYDESQIFSSDDREIIDPFLD